MRDWVLLTAPLAAIVYFIIFPRQFIELLSWAGTLLY